MKKILILILLSFTVFGLTGCSKAEEESDENDGFVFDPGSPGSNIDGINVVRPLINFKGCPNLDPESDCPTESFEDNGKITLTWNVPNLYSTEEYVVVIFRLEQDSVFDSEETRVGLNSPQNNLGVINFEIARLKDTSFEDTDIREGNTYFYYGFVVLEGFLNPTQLTGEQVLGNWSSSSQITIISTSGGISSGVPSPQDFWEKKRFNYASSSGTVGDIANLRTFDPGIPTSTIPKGRITADSSGSMAFVSDTDNNRIVIWENANLRSCLQQLLSSDEAQDEGNRDIYIYNCYLSNQGAPLSAHNVLGQPSQFDTLSCEGHNNECAVFLSEEDCNADHDLGFGGYPSFCKWQNNSCIVKGNQCLTQPTEVLYNRGQLIVSDTGNDRVVLYEDVLFSPGNTTEDIDLSIIGCDPAIIPNFLKPVKCSFQKVFGKKTSDDFTSYTLSSGEASLNNPTGLLVDESDLYIADTLNNRVVKVGNFYGAFNGDGTDLNDFYDCNDSSWLTSLCRWSGVLGQQNYSQTLSLQDFYDNDNSILTGTFSNIISDATLLKRYFKNPTKLSKMTKANGDVKFLVLSNEDFFTISDLGTQVALRSRILMFDDIPLKGSSPVCNSLTFGTGSCSAESVIGQEDFDKLIILSGSAGGAGDYKNVVFGLDNVNDFSVKGDSIYAVDNDNNFVYVWSNLFENNNVGIPYTFKVNNPEGEYISASIGNLPDLKGLTGIHYSETGDIIYIVDGQSGVFYQLQFLNFNF
jgi:hypothetical protein